MTVKLHPRTSRGKSSPSECLTNLQPYFLIRGFQLEYKVPNLIHFRVEMAAIELLWRKRDQQLMTTTHIFNLGRTTESLWERNMGLVPLWSKTRLILIIRAKMYNTFSLKLNRTMREGLWMANKSRNLNKLVVCQKRTWW